MKTRIYAAPAVEGLTLSLPSSFLYVIKMLVWLTMFNLKEKKSSKTNKMHTKNRLGLLIFLIVYHGNFYQMSIL